MQAKQPEQDESQPVGQLTYFNILAQSIQRINEAIMDERKDPRLAATILQTDLPDDWISEIKSNIDKQTAEYNKEADKCNAVLKLNVKDSTKRQAQHDLRNASIEYGMNIKQIAISLFKRKNILFPTKKSIEHGAISLYELTGEKEPDDE